AILHQLTTERLPDITGIFYLETGNPPRNRATRNFEQIYALYRWCSHKHPKSQGKREFMITVTYFTEGTSFTSFNTSIPDVEQIFQWPKRGKQCISSAFLMLLRILRQEGQEQAPIATP